MNGKRIGVAVVGVRGWSSRAHIPALQSLPDIDLLAVCAAHTETAQQAAERSQVPLAFHDYRELMSHPEVDLVTIAVGVPLHVTIAQAALEAGKHVFCEWLLAMDSAEAEILVLSQGGFRLVQKLVSSMEQISRESSRHGTLEVSGGLVG